MVHKAICLILALAGMAWADTGYRNLIQVTETDNSPRCTAGQLVFQPNQVTCAGQKATMNIVGGSGGASALEVIANGVFITSPTATIMFSGAGVSGSASGSTATITITGGGGGDNLGSHVATMTVTANYGIAVTSGTFSDLVSMSTVTVSSGTFTHVRISSSSTTSILSARYGSCINMRVEGSGAFPDSYCVAYPGNGTAGQMVIMNNTLPANRQSYGLYSENNNATSGTGATHGAWIYAANGAFRNYGIKTTIETVGATSTNYGGYFLTQNASTNANYGVYAKANGATNADNYGGYFETGTAPDQTNIAVYAKGGQTGLYAEGTTEAIRAAGNVYITSLTPSKFVVTDSGNLLSSYDLLNASPTYTGQGLWTSVEPSTFTTLSVVNQASVGTLQGASLATCGDATHALSWTGGNFGCQEITVAPGTGDNLGNGIGSYGVATTTGGFSGAVTAASFAGDGAAVLNVGGISLSTGVVGVLPDANVANDITLTDITQITNRSHTSLSDIGTRTHAQLDTSIDNLGASTGTLKTSVDALGASTGTLKTSVDALGASTGTLKTSIDNLGASTGTLKTSIDNLGASTGTIKTTVDSHTTSIGNLGASTGTLKTSVDSLGASTGTIQTSLTGLTAQVSTAAYLQTNNVWTGNNDFGGGTGLELPNGASPTVDATGEVAFDTTDGVIVAFDGATANVVGFATHSVTVTISSGTGWNSLAIPVWRAPTDMAITITKVMAESLPTGTTVLYQLDERAFGSINSAGTNIFTVEFSTANNTGTTETALTNPGIAAQASVVFKTPAASAGTGNPDLVTFTIFYKRDRE